MRFLRFGLILALLSLIPACVERPSTLDKPTSQAHVGATLAIAVPDQNTYDLLTQLSKSWANRSGATVKIVLAPFDGTSDIGILPPAAMPKFAHEGKLAELPSMYRERNNSYTWDDLFTAYSSRLLTWKDRPYALPVRAEGMVLVYRKSAFDGKDGRKPLPPQTWSELADLGQGSLPPLRDPNLLAAQFLSAVACYDLPAVNRITTAKQLEGGFFNFLFNYRSGDPIISRQVFPHVALYFKQMHENRSKVATVAEAFQDPKVSAGILTLSELASLPDSLTPLLGVAPLPGATVTYEKPNGPTPTANGALNRVPYFGWGGQVGVVSKSSANAEAAWEFLASVGHPDQAAGELVAAGRWGAGPFRISQVETKARSMWFGYRLTALDTDNLTTALRDNMGTGVQNYRFHLRTPNQQELSTLFNTRLQTMIEDPKSNPPEAFKALEAEWRALAEKQPDWPALARTSLGL